MGFPSSNVRSTMPVAPSKDQPKKSFALYRKEKKTKPIETEKIEENKMEDSPLIATTSIKLESRLRVPA
jgi:hypothetical protein